MLILESVREYDTFMLKKKLFFWFFLHVPQTLDSITFTAANQAFKIAPFFNNGVVYPLIFKVFLLDIHLDL
ncbi:MAG TPA: hypothetical protein DEB23_03910 [Chitinophagaceae bacterium]|nr:hypothetical protein [Chitinophagaceae bacterium]